jgi:hypothetical protein
MHMLEHAFEVVVDREIRHVEHGELRIVEDYDSEETKTAEGNTSRIHVGGQSHRSEYEPQQPSQSLQKLGG